MARMLGRLRVVATVAEGEGEGWTEVELCSLVLPGTSGDFTLSVDGVLVRVRIEEPADAAVVPK